jgi:hypothetical protein
MTETMENIIPAGDRVTEPEVTQALINMLQTCAYGEADFKKIFFELPRWIKISDEDREIARTRNGELKWHAMVRNISAHYDKPGNAIYEGLLVKRRGGGFQLASRVKK